MKPSRLLLIWLAALCLIGILTGTLQALDIDVPATLLSINWGLLLALLVLALIDALRLNNLPSPRIQRQIPGSLALGRWSEVHLQLSHDFNEPVALKIFDHVPQGLSFENLPLAVELQPGQFSEVAIACARSSAVTSASNIAKSTCPARSVCGLANACSP